MTSCNSRNTGNLEQEKTVDAEEISECPPLFLAEETKDEGTQFAFVRAKIFIQHQSIELWNIADNLSADSSSSCDAEVNVDDPYKIEIEDNLKPGFMEKISKSGEIIRKSSF